jgi:hypothetical protein
MLTTIMGNNPFGNGKYHSSFLPRGWDIAHIMKNTLVENLQKAVKESGSDMKTVSVQARLGETYVRDVIAGRVVDPTYGKLAKVARVLNTTVAQLAGETILASVPVVGYVDPNERVFLFFGDLQRMQDITDKDIEIHSLKLIKPPLGIANMGDLLMFEQMGDYGSLIYPKDSQIFARASKIITSNFDRYTGKRVIAQFDDHIYIRELDRGSDPGHFTLLSVGGRDHIKNVRLKAVVPIYSVHYPE